MRQFFEIAAERQRNIARNEANHAANTGAFAKFRSTGQGPIEFPTAIDFAVAYSEEPWLSYGSAIDGTLLRDSLSLGDDDTPPFPLTSGFVTEWQQDSNGFYVGAWVGARVHFPFDIPVSLDLDVEVIHYYRFEAMALKGI